VLVESLLALARADARTATPERLDLDAVVADRVAAWSALAAERGVRLVAERAGDATARAATDRVVQVLDNLIENALDVSPPGGTIWVATRGGGRWAEVRVRDQGPGLDDEQRERAFDRFWRARDGEGSGLGLAIVRTLVKADGGEVELRTATGGGLEAVVRLRAERP